MQQRYTHQLFLVAVNSLKLRSLNYLGLCLITLDFHLLSQDYKDVRKLIVRWLQVQVLVGLPVFAIRGGFNHRHPR